MSLVRTYIAVWGKTVDTVINSPARKSLQQFLRPKNYLYQPKFEDKYIKHGIDFKHSWAQMSHMHDLRQWTITYAPTNKTNIQRMNECHALNQEMWYMVYRAVWTRFLWGIPLWFFIKKFRRDKMLKKYNYDSHDANYRDVTAHM